MLPEKKPKKKRPKSDGVWIQHRPKFGSWRVMWRDAERRQQSATFRSRAAAEAHRTALLDRRHEHGIKGLSGFDAAAAQEISLIRRALAGASISQLLAVWERHKNEVLGGETGLTLESAVKRYIALREHEGMGDERLRHARLHLDRLVSSWPGETQLIAVDADALRRWLVVMRDTHAFTPVTLLHYLKSAKAFFARAKREGWLVANPAESVMAPKIQAREVTVLPVKEGEKLFEANKAHPVSLLLALEAFGALRYTSAVRLRIDDIRWTERGILLPGALHKTGKRHYLEKLPKNLWAWLNHWRDTPEAWNMTQRQYLKAKGEAFARAGVRNPGNVLRHSFCSYHVALNGDAARTAVLLQHADQAMLYKHYKGVATSADAKRWFAIAP